jgi:hypothetical protein
MNEPRTATVLGGRYRLEERLAAGGMGTVWSATDEVLNRRVAVKILNEGLADDERFIERFRREAKAAALAAPADAAVTTPIRPSRRPDTKLLVAAAVLVAVVLLGVLSVPELRQRSAQGGRHQAVPLARDRGARR